MESMSLTWDALCINAVHFHLDMQEFTHLKLFYDRMDKAFFPVAYHELIFKSENGR